MTEKGSLRHMACLARPEYAGGTPVTHDLNLVFTLAGGLSAALVLGFITQMLRLSPLVGYLLAEEREAGAVRLVMAGKQNGFDMEAIRERLRDLYG